LLLLLHGMAQLLLPLLLHGSVQLPLVAGLKSALLLVQCTMLLLLGAQQQQMPALAWPGAWQHCLAAAAAAAAVLE
jgi:hypothetical protein